MPKMEYQTDGEERVEAPPIQVDTGAVEYVRLLVFFMNGILILDCGNPGENDLPAITRNSGYQY